MSISNEDTPYYFWFMLDESSKILDFSTTMSCLKYSSGELVGRNWFDFFIISEKIYDEIVQTLYESSYTLVKRPLHIKCKNAHCHYIDVAFSLMRLENSRRYLIITGHEHT